MLLLGGGTFDWNWDASGGKCLQTLGISKALFNISIDTTSLYLHTKISTITINALTALYITLSIIDPPNP